MILNLPYLVPRVIRRFLPEKLVRALLLRSWIIRPGLETSNPAEAVHQYVDVLSRRGLSIQNKRILVFGYGGRFDTGFGLLNEGASHVVLCDKYAPPDDMHNRRLFSSHEKYFITKKDKVQPRTEWMTLLEADIRDAHVRDLVEPVDVVVSSSVYEHLEDVEGVTSALAVLTKPSGIQIHFVDLRDHFFRYPFEMLRFSRETWLNWLNPSSNHNRYRLWNYRSVFESCFENVDIEILTREVEAFQRLLPNIRPEFISGNMQENAAALIRVLASKPYMNKL